MQNFIITILAPYFESVKVRLGLLHAQCSLWLINCWSVHQSEEFLTWMAVNHDTIIILFVPAGCTGLLQPSDVGFQHVFKHSLKILTHTDVVQEVLTQLKSGVSVSDVKIDTTLKILHDQTVHWLWTTFKSLNSPEIMKKVHLTFIFTHSFYCFILTLPQAWKMCKASPFDLSYESLTSHEAQQALCNLPNTDLTFFTEISQPCSHSQHAAPVLNNDQAAQEDSEAQYSGADALDDSDVPVPEVDAHQVELVSKSQTNSTQQDEEDLVHTYVTDDKGGLSSVAEAEDTLIESIDSHIVDVTSAFMSRATCIHHSNILYSGKEWMDSDNIIA